MAVIKRILWRGGIKVRQMTRCIAIELPAFGAAPAAISVRSTLSCVVVQTVHDCLVAAAQPNGAYACRSLLRLTFKHRIRVPANADSGNGRALLRGNKLCIVLPVMKRDA